MVLIALYLLTLIQCQYQQWVTYQDKIIVTQLFNKTQGLLANNQMVKVTKRLHFPGVVQLPLSTIKIGK